MKNSFTINQITRNVCNKINLISAIFIAVFILNNIANISYAQQEYYITNGTVNDVEVVGEKLYIGGAFTSLTPARGSFATLNTSGAFNTAIPKVSGGTVLDIASDGSGGWYIAGNFTKVDGFSMPYLAHIFSTGALDTSWNPNPDSEVYALDINGTDLYVAGNFNNIGGSSRTKLASFDTTTGTLGTTINLSIDDVIYDVVYSGGVIYIGGTFTTVGVSSRGSLAGINAVTGLVNSFDVGTNGYVDTIAVDGTNVYFGGSFSSVLGTTAESRNNLALASTSNVISSWSPNPNSIVKDITTNGTDLYVMGQFNFISLATRNGIAKYSATTQAFDSLWDANLDNVSSIETAVIAGDGNIYIGGLIYTIASSTVYNITAVNALTATAAGFSPYFSGTVNVIEIDGTDIAVGGAFGGFETKVDRNNLAAIDLRTGEPTTFNPNLNQLVNTLFSNGTNLYVGGGFSQVGAVTRGRAAAFSLSDETLTSWDPDADYTVRDIEANGTNILLAGDFTDINNGTPRTGVAEVDSSAGIVTSLIINTSSSVSTIEVLGSDLYIGGSFASVNGQPRSRLAMASLIDGTVSAWNPNADSIVNGIFLNNAGPLTIYVAGFFSNVGGAARGKIAELNTSGTATTWDPITANPSLGITIANSVTRRGSDIIVSGGFHDLNVLYSRPFAKFDSTTAVLTESPSGIGRGNVTQVFDSQVFGGGDFIGVLGEAYQNLAVIGGNLSNIAVPLITGTLQDTQTLTSTTGFWRGVPRVTFDRQWYQCDSSGVLCNVISGETGITYLLTSGDVGSTLQIRVTATDINGTPTTETTTSGVIDPINSVLPTLSGTTIEGSTLTAGTGSWNGVTGLTFNYQWRRCNSSGASCSDISSETDPTYILTALDAGSTIRVRVSAQKNGSAGNNGVESAQSAVISALPTAVPTSTGTNTPVSIPTVEPTVTMSPQPTPTIQPTPICAPPKPSAKISNGKVVVSFPRVTKLNGCVLNSVKASLSFTTRGRTKTFSSKFKRISKRAGSKKAATIIIKTNFKNKRGQLKLTAKDTLLGINVSGITKNIKTK